MKQQKATRRLQQTLRKHPYDTKTLLQLANSLGALTKSDIDQKRNLLHRVLHLEPDNGEARQMLFEMDRAMIGGNVSRLSAAVILTKSSSIGIAERPLILRYSIIHQLLLYLAMVLTALAGWSLIPEPDILALVVGFLVSLLVPLWFVSAVIEVDTTGLIVSRLFGMVRSEIAWNEIRECKPNPLGGMKIITCNRTLVDISRQIYSYPILLDILRQIRPDLFEASEVQGRAVSHHVTLSLVR